MEWETGSFPLSGFRSALGISGLPGTELFRDNPGKFRYQGCLEVWGEFLVAQSLWIVRGGVRRTIHRRSPSSSQKSPRRFPKTSTELPTGSLKLWGGGRKRSLAIGSFAGVFKIPREAPGYVAACQGRRGGMILNKIRALQIV